MKDRSSPLLVAAACLLFAAPAVGAQDRWSVWVDAQDVTALANPRLAGNSIFVDIKGLAPVLGLVVEVLPDRIVIRAHDGTRWTGRETAMALHGPTSDMPLSAPMLGVGPAIYVEIEAATRLSGRELRLHPAEQRADLAFHAADEHGTAEPTRSPAGAARAFRIPKTAAELTAGREFDPADALATLTPIVPQVPARHDVFSLGTAVGYVPGHDAATELTGAGRIHGLEADLNAFVTLGDRGPELYNGRFTLRDQDARRALLVGDLVSETRGLARGATFSWRIGRRRASAVSVYQPRFPRGGDRTVVSYRDQIALSRHLVAEGELASDRSLVAKMRLATERVAAETYHHQGPSGRDFGGLASVDLWRGLRAGGAARRSEGTNLSERFEQGFLQVQLGKGASIRMERSHVRHATNDNSTNAATLTLPIGPVHVLARWQDRDLETFSQYGQARVAERGLLAAASYAPTPRVKLNLQIANEWLQDGRVRDVQEFNANLQVTSGTAVQATGVLTAVESTDRVRVRVSQKLRRELSLVAEIGRFSAFQAPLVATDAFPSRFKLFVRKEWNVSSPARGSRVSGRVVDQLGTGVAGAVVRLGSYRTTTTRTGGYTFERVPRGTYSLALDSDHLPASYAARDAERRVAARHGHDVTEHFVVAPLNAIHGRVYADDNNNGQFDAGEELAGVILRVSDRLTSSGTDGRYAFYNLPPGSFQVNVLVDRLPPEYELATPASFRVVLEAGQPAHAADVRVIRKRKRILFQSARGQS
jgi:hypothetical protein